MCGSTRGAATVLSVCRGRVGHAVTWPNLGKASRTVHFFGSAVASTSWLHVRRYNNLSAIDPRIQFSDFVRNLVNLQIFVYTEHSCVHCSR